MSPGRGLAALPHAPVRSTTDRPMRSNRVLWPLLLVVLAGAWLYRGTVAGLVHDWAYDDNYSHGFLIVPVAAYFVWERRGRLARAVPKPSMAGLLVVLASLAMLVTG